ncbi:unnamed protein product [Plutella xylostella]|uniref:(diamondback moth) hypothetical protein n=1 Tax=Plutella xylostella TaxID=51655 RepID=A0A8S4GCH3_PLUXY|nr:unnamed protein product [Plutella xylostella]
MRLNSIRTLGLAEELGDAAVEAQACYSLGNTYTLLREYRTAEEYHARHLAAARALHDRVGEGRCTGAAVEDALVGHSGNAHAALGNHEKALYYATEHYNISKELGDALGMATAQMNTSDLRKVLNLPDEEIPPAVCDDAGSPHTPFNALRITPDGKRDAMASKKPDKGRADSEDNPQESFFNLLTRCQSARMEDQRATLHSNKENRMKEAAKRAAAGGQDNSSSAAQTTDKTGAGATPAATGPKSETLVLRGAASAAPEDEFLDMLARVQVSILVVLCRSFGLNSLFLWRMVPRIKAPDWRTNVQNCLGRSPSPLRQCQTTILRTADARSGRPHGRPAGYGEMKHIS